MTSQEISTELIALFRERSTLRYKMRIHETRICAIEQRIDLLCDQVPEEKFPPEVLAKIAAAKGTP